MDSMERPTCLSDGTAAVEHAVVTALQQKSMRG